MHTIRMGEATPDHRLVAILSRAEQERAERLRSEQARRRWIVARLLLRRILAASVGCTPQSLTFMLGEFGRPFLMEPHSALDFNMSHCEDVVVIVESTDARCGVDVEQRERLHDAADTLLRFFRAEEAGRILASADPVRTLAEHWCVKEAYLKALGCGLTRPVQRIEASPLGRTAVNGHGVLPPGWTAWSVREEAEHDQTWMHASVAEPQGSVTAICVRSRVPGATLRVRTVTHRVSDLLELQHCTEGDHAR